MRIRGSWVLVVALASTGLPAFADEILYFTNEGAPMAIRSHTIEGDMIQVELLEGEGNMMSFPRSQVERIEDASGQTLTTRPTPNQIVPSAGQATAWGEVPSRMRRGGWDPEGKMTAPQDQDVATTRPLASATNPKMANISVTGRRSTASLEGTGRTASTATAGRRQLNPSSVTSARPIGMKLIPRKTQQQGDARRGK